MITVKNKNFVLKRQDGTIVPYEIMNEVKQLAMILEYYNGMENFHDAGEVFRRNKNLNYKLRLHLSYRQWAMKFLKCVSMKELQKTRRRCCHFKNGAENKYFGDAHSRRWNAFCYE